MCKELLHLGEVDAIRKEEYVGEKADQLAPNVPNTKQPFKLEGGMPPYLREA